MPVVGGASQVSGATSFYDLIVAPNRF